METSDLNRMQDLARRWTDAQPTVTAFILALVPRRHDAEELLQRTAAAAVEKFATFDPSRNFVTWAIGIARIEVLRERERRRRENALFVFDTETVEAVAEAFSQEALHEPAIRAALDVCVGRLRGRVREIFQLHLLQGLSISEIAMRFGRTPNAVLVGLHRGRASVRECLRRKLEMPGSSLAEGGAS